MMKTTLFSALLALTALMFSGCREGIDKVLVGTWNVTKVQGVFNSGGQASPAVEDNNPTGTITFKNNGRGSQNYTFTLNGVAYPQTGDFTWSATDDLIIIERTTEPDMEWTRITDTDNKQVASYNILVNANQSWDYTLTLEK